MNVPTDIVLFGVKSPLVVDYEETLARLGLTLVAAVSVEGPARCLARARIVPVDEIGGRFSGIGFIPCAFAPQNRRKLRDRAEALGLTLHPGLVDPKAVVARSTRLGAGAFVNAGVVIGGASLIDKCVLVNRNASIGHHCVIGECVSIGPGVTLASNISVGRDAVIGAGATILPGVKIGNGAVVSGGSLVRRDVTAETLVSGNPARPSRLRPGQTHVVSNEQE